MEDLAAMLAEILARQGTRDPFQGETVLVQSRGMGRWLSLQLADARGICLNVRFPFPREAIEQVLGVLLPRWRSSTAFRKETMAWKLFRLLDTFRKDARFGPISHYLEGGDPLKRMQLADRLAHLFDQYLVYRPDLLANWEKNAESEDWQATLWRKLVEETPGEVHFGRVAADLARAKCAPELESLPPRLYVFGISSLPPLFLEVLRNYARFGELHLFLLQPTDLYWGDLVSRKKQARISNAAGATAAIHFEEGHPLVASLGRQGQDFLNLLIDHEFQQPDAGEKFSEPESDSLLCQLQTNILRLKSGDGGRIAVEDFDSSIQVHSCHGPMREVEVLRDQLLDCFAKDATLRPRDVLVMIPDIEAYAPYIHAVFGSPESPRAQIPFSVVDRRPRSAYRAIDVWFHLLELAGSRFAARDAIALLESPTFRSRFGLADRDVNCLRSWIQSTGIRWGIDAAHREEQGLPPLAETTWQNGIDQWLLGFAMRERQDGAANSFHGLYPFDEIEGGNIALFDLFLTALDFLFRARAMLQAPRPLRAWCDTFSKLLEDLFGDLEDVAREANAIRAGVADLGRIATAAQVEEPLPLDVVRYFLEKTIDDTVSSGGFLTGGVTFCTLQPMRTIPARVVCLLGMNDDAFPRRPRQLGFDRMRDDRRVGDRSIREDDRYLFLETLLSVRETLLISYVGQSARDLSEAPPSVLVSELLDHLDAAFSFPAKNGARQFLVRRHRLQPFHPDYFQGGRLFSYSAGNAEACRRLMGEQHDSPPFIRTKLSEPEPEWRTVTVQQLVRFFRNPAEYFVKERLGLRLPQEEAVLEDSEMFSVNPLAEYSLRKDAVDGLVEKRETHEWQRLQARGQVPLGSPGLAACHAIHKDAERFVAKLSAAIDATETRSNRAVDLHLGEFHLRGELGPFFGDNLVLYRPARLKANDCVAGWIQHLASCTGNRQSNTTLIADNGMVALPPREDSEKRLDELLRLYWRGLSEPLPFFPETAWTYLEVLERKDPVAAQAAACGKFTGPSTDYSRCEMEDTSVRLCWAGREEEAIGEDFGEIARTVFAEFELLNSRKEGA